MGKVAKLFMGPGLGLIVDGKEGFIRGLTGLAAALGGPVSFGLYITSSLASGMAARGGGSTSSSVGSPTVTRQTIADSFIIYGKRRVGGLMVFFHPRVSGSDHYRYFVIACAGHRCQGVVQWMLGDEVVTVDGSNKVTSGKYANAAWLWFQRGLASETANATFVSECAGKWTSAHKGNGVAAIYAKFKMTDAVVQAGMPNITAVIEGKDDIFDPRDETEGYTANAALVFYDWMQIPREEGGFGAYPDEIPDPSWISAQANVCDETVDGEPRYELNAVLTTGAAPSEVRDAFMVNCAGTYAYTGGKHLMRVGYWVPPSETLSEDDLAGPIQVSPFMPSDAVSNEVQGTFVDPGAGYQAATFTTQSVASDDVRQTSLELAFTTSLGQADRVARIALRRALAEKTVAWPMNIAGLKVQAMDTVQLGTARYGLSNYAFSVAGWSLSGDWDVTLSLREENEEIYDDGSPVSPDAPPELDAADPLLLQSETSQLILNSYVTDADPADGLIQATDVQITVETYTRTYGDKTVSVTGGTITTEDDGITGLTATTQYHIYYDDITRAGGAVALKATKSGQTAANSPSQPGRHYVGTITTDVVGGTGTTAGGQAPPGWDPDDYCVSIDSMVMMAGGTSKRAGDLAAGDFVWTRHEHTLRWGAFRVSKVEIAEVPVMSAAGWPDATPDHRFACADWLLRWLPERLRFFRMYRIGRAAGTAKVAKIRVADAHTYLARHPAPGSRWRLSHNIKA